MTTARPYYLARIPPEELARLYSGYIVRHRLCSRRVVPVGLRQVSWLRNKKELENLRRIVQINDHKNNWELRSIASYIEMSPSCLSSWDNRSRQADTSTGRRLKDSCGGIFVLHFTRLGIDTTQRVTVEQELRAYGYGTLTSASCYILNNYMVRSYLGRGSNESLDAIKKAMGHGHAVSWRE